MAITFQKVGPSRGGVPGTEKGGAWGDNDPPRINARGHPECPQELSHSKASVLMALRSFQRETKQNQSFGHPPESQNGCLLAMGTRQAVSPVCTAFQLSWDADTAGVTGVRSCWENHTTGSAHSCTPRYGTCGSHYLRARLPVGAFSVPVMPGTAETCLLPTPPPGASPFSKPGSMRSVPLLCPVASTAVHMPFPKAPCPSRPRGMEAPKVLPLISLGPILIPRHPLHCFPAVMGQLSPPPAPPSQCQP